MSKDSAERAGALLSVEEIAEQVQAKQVPAEQVLVQNQAELLPLDDLLPDTPPDQNKAEGTEPSSKELINPSKLTVDQYLKRATQGAALQSAALLSAGISELVRSLYRTKILSFEEWNDTVKALLKKSVR